MPDLKRMWRWHRWEPGLGGNLELEPTKRFWLELAVGLSKVEKDALGQVRASAVPEGLEGDALAAAVKASEAEYEAAWIKNLEPFVRLGTEPLSVEGVPVKTLGDYVALLFRQPGLLDWSELISTLMHLNGAAGATEVFAARLSGGSSGTARASTI